MLIRDLRPGERPQDMCREGYNAAADKYNTFTLGLVSPRLEWLEKFYAHLNANTTNTNSNGNGNDAASASVLELGCGTGDPCTVHLANHVAHLTATDISSAQLDFARKALEAAGCLPAEKGKSVQLVESDMMELVFDKAQFDGACAFYSTQSLPIAEQKQLFARIFAWLKPDGLLLFNCAADPDEGKVMEGWLGMNAYSAGLGEARALETVRETGFEIMESWTGGMEVNVQFTWIIARKSAL